MFQATISRTRGVVPVRERESYRAAPSIGAAQPATGAERILFVSDDEQFRAPLCGLLALHGYANVLGMSSLAAFGSSAALTNVDVAIVDTSASCGEALRALRKLKTSDDTSIVVIVANGRTFASRELATNGDVVLAKPFDPRELVFVVRGMLHGRGRSAARGRESLSAGPVTLHALLNTATVAAREVGLTGAETRVLEELMINAGKPVTRDQLTRCALGRPWSPFDRSLDTHMNRLRRKIGKDVVGRTPIRTIRSIGYLMLSEWEPRM